VTLGYDPLGNPSGPEEDLQSLLVAKATSVLSYALANLPSLPVFQSFWEDKPVLERVCDKVVAETALLVLLAARLGGTFREIASSSRALARGLEPLARPERTALSLRRHPETVMSLGFAHTALTAAGFPDENFEEIVSSAFATGQASSIERLPFRELDLRWQEHLREGSAAPRIDDIWPYTTLCRNPNPCFMLREEIYALTHDVFYSTDFGRADLPLLRGVQVGKRLAHLIDALLAGRIAAYDYDLILELILAKICARQRWSPHVSFGFDFAAKVESHTGYLPGPSYEASVAAALQPLARAAYEFRHRYHTYYVFGLVCLAALDTPAESPMLESVREEALAGPSPQATARECIAIGTRSVRLASKHPLDDKFSDVSRNRRCAEVAANEVAEPQKEVLPDRSPEGSEMTVSWVDVLENSHLDAQAQTLVALDCVVMQACRDYDLPVLVGALTLLMRAPVSDTFAVRCCAQYLACQVRCDGAVGAQSVAERKALDIEHIRFAREAGSGLFEVARFLLSLG
jgi:hypothetical protein